MAVDDSGAVVLPSEGNTISFYGNRVRFVYTEPEGAYSLVEFVAPPGAPGTPLHLPRATDEACYVLEGTFGFQSGERTLELTERAFVFVPRGLQHAFWNGGTTSARLLFTISPAGFERYFEDLAEGLAAAGDDVEAAMSLRKALSEKHDIEVVRPPRQATG
jgi:mannose-6-phosphate isomerase-like protein (cupin superfamily)